MEIIKRDFDSSSAWWSVEIDGRTITIWEDGDIIFDISNEEDVDMLIPYAILRQICNAADDYFAARYNYKNSK